MDSFLFEAINQWAGKFFWLDALAVFFARYFEFFLIFVLLVFLAKDYKKYWKILLEAAIAAVLARFVIVEVIRWLLPSPRPFVENNVNLLFNYDPSAASFPSGHAAFYFAIAAVVYFYNKKAGIFFFISAFLISLARVFAGVHWPSDILAGAIVGIFSGWLVSKVTKRLR